MVHLILKVIHWKQEGIHPLATLHRDTLRRDTLHQATLHPATHLRDTLHNTHLNTLPHHHLNNNINTNPVAAVAWKAAWLLYAAAVSLTHASDDGNSG
ncbi:Hypothetical predicted protein [Olea europaea subsp. europaea]|uniref:Uncharacterized protein n=1 Tax=Olea europaea subsp. europaea TaxID=158383 RepID=A0A8S0SYZ9_OLEEU|nr:Hypothetical predicted protein [Olea europaea subsp. europaea]